MKSPQSLPVASKAKQLPKPRLRYLDPHTNLIYAVQGWVGEDPMVRNGRVPVLVLPQPSVSSARAALKNFWGRPEHEQFAAINEILSSTKASWLKTEELLALVHGRGKK